MKIRCSAPRLILLASLLCSKAAGDIDLQNGNILLVSENVLVQVDRTGDVVDGAFLPIPFAFDVALDTGGGILVAGTDFDHPPAIHRIGTNGMMLSSNTPAVSFESFALTPDGDVLLGAGTTVFRVDAVLNFVDAFPIPPAPGSAPYINGISVDRDGQIYVAAWSQNGRASVIHRMDAEGNLLQTLGPYSFEIAGLAVDTNRHIFYTREGRDQAGFPLPSAIVELDEDGLELRAFSAPFRADGITLIQRTPLRPKLLIGCAQDNVILRWPTNLVGFQLQAASTSSLQSWGVVKASPTIVDKFFSVTIRAADSASIFRLIKSP